MAVTDRAVERHAAPAAKRRPEIDFDVLRERLAVARKDPGLPPAASVIVPVNAQGDLRNVLHVVRDVARYEGRHAIECVLVINNFPPERPPREIEEYRDLGMTVLGVPSVRRRGEAPGFTARIHGLRAAGADHAVLFDADCRVPNPTALIDWYVDQLRNGARVAYTRVDFYDLRKGWSLRARLRLHYAARWAKRVLLRIPTSRGSNYAVHRSTILHLYDLGMLAEDLNVGPTVKWARGRVAYSAAPELVVLTSGRMLNTGWRRLLRYAVNRLRYNFRVLPVGMEAARRTGRGGASAPEGGVTAPRGSARSNPGH